MIDTDTVLEVRGLTKRFGATLALNGVDLALARGEIHALLGENGAGKSTLIKILAGVHQPDGGTVVLGGAEVDPRSGLPISFIHQDLGLVDDMTVAENVAITAGYARRFGLVDWRRIQREAREALKSMGHGIHPTTLIARLPAAERAVVAIARALVVNAEVLVLDEPTAPLPEADVERLFGVLRRLRDNGMAILYVTHRLDEVFRISDRVTVLRDGERVASGETASFSGGELVRKIVGRDVEQVFKRPAGKAGGDVLLRLDELMTGPIGPVSLDVHRGEIVAFVGLRGAGHHLIGRALAGVAPVSAGTLALEGRDVRFKTPRDGLAAGISFLPSNRGEEGLFGGRPMAPILSVQENLFPNPAKRLAPTRPRAERSVAWQMVDAFNIRPRDPSRPISMLSGGNQQKVVLARAMNVGKKVLVLEEPTAGVDVGAKADIYELMNLAADDGKSVVLISSDFEEVANISHRAIVFIGGRMTAEVSGDELSVERLTALASGAS